METRALVAAVAILGVQSLAPAVAVQDGESILTEVDSVTNTSGDMRSVEQMTLFAQENSQKLREVEWYQKSRERLRMRSFSPAEVHQLDSLRLAADRQYLYLYLPAFRKVWRIASSVKNEGFTGTGFPYEPGHSGLYNYLLARIERNFPNEQLESTMVRGRTAAWRIGFRKSYGYSAFSERSYQPVDNLEAVLGSFLVGGKAGTTFGAWEEVDQAYFGVKVHF